MLRYQAVSLGTIWLLKNLQAWSTSTGTQTIEKSSTSWEISKPKTFTTSQDLASSTKSRRADATWNWNPLLRNQASPIKRSTSTSRRNISLRTSWSSTWSGKRLKLWTSKLTRTNKQILRDLLLEQGDLSTQTCPKRRKRLCVLLSATTPTQIWELSSQKWQSTLNNSATFRTLKSSI